MHLNSKTGLSLAALAATAGLLALAAPAQAGFTDTRAAFNSANPGLTTLTFEGIAPSGDFVEPAPSFTGQGVTFSSPGFGTDSDAVSSASFFGTPSDVFFINEFDAELDMDFSPGVTAVGFDLASNFPGVAASPVTVTALNGATVLDSETFTPDDAAAFTSFAGFSGFGQDITKVTFSVAQGDFSFPLIDNVEFGSPAAVPEASTTASFGLLLALGMGGVLVAAKRKKAASAA